MRKPDKHSAGKQDGVSLIELMIAMILGLLVLGAVIQLFVGSKATYTSNEALARVQENGRFALELIKQDVRGTSNRGMCGARINVTSHLDDEDCDESVSMLFDARHSIVGWDFDGTGRGEDYTIPEDLDPAGADGSSWQSMGFSGTAEDLPSVLEGRVVPGSDVFITRNRERLDITVTGVKNGNQLDVSSGGDTIPPGSVVMVVNCATGADLFQQSMRNNDGANPTKPPMSCSENGPGNKPPGTNPWGTAHDESSSVYTLTTVAYYVGMNDDLNEPALYRHDITGGTTEEIVSGIENLQVLYGYSNPADEGGDGQTVNHWLPANEVPNWGFVIGARLSFLVRSPENMGDGTVQRTFDLAGTNITHQEDGRLRHPFLASISLRNQQLVM